MFLARITGNNTGGRGKHRTPGPTQGGDPPFSSEGLWGPSWNYTDSIWSVTDAAGTPVGGVGSPLPALANEPDLLTAMTGSKHTAGFYRASTGRVYHGWGDFSTHGFQIDGKDCQTNDGANPAFYSFDPDDPTTMRMECASIPSDIEANDNVWYCHADEGFAVHDTDQENKLYVCPLVSNEGDDFEGGDEPEVPIFVNANSIKFTGDVTSKYQVRKKICVYMDHPTGLARTPKRGRISASNFAAGETTITIAWIDTIRPLTMQAPTAVRLAFNNVVAVPRVSFPNQLGGWSLNDRNCYKYDDVAQKWYTYLGVFDMDTRTWSALVFEVPTKDDLTRANFKAAVFVPAGATNGRGKEIFAFGRDAGGNAALFLYNFANGTLNVDNTGSWLVSINGNSVVQPWPCFDGNKYVYTWLWVESRLGRVNTQTLERITFPITIGGLPLTSDATPAGDDTYLNTGAKYDAIHCLWNTGIRRIELWLNRVQFGAGGGMRIFAIDPLPNPPTVEVLALLDQNDLDIRTNNPIPIPPVGDVPARTLCVGDLGEPPYDTTPKPDKFRTFVAENKRVWEPLANSNHYWRTFGPPGRPDIAGNGAVIQINKGCYPIYGSMVAEVDANGIETGVVYNRQGGDGGLACMQVMLTFLNNISAGTLPVQINLAVDGPSSTQWGNKLHSNPRPGGGTTAARDTILNPADLTQWWPSAIHGNHRVGYHPSVGYIEDHHGPMTLPATAADWPVGYEQWPGQANPYWTPEAYGFGGDNNPNGLSPIDPQLVDRRIISWNRQGGLAGLWRARTTNPIQGGLEEWKSQVTGDYNGSTGKTLHCWEDGFGLMYVNEWDGATNTLTFVRTVSVGDGSAIIGYYGDQTGDCFWLEGNKYIFFRNHNSGPSGGSRYSLWEGGANALPLIGVNGNSIIDNAHAGNRPVYLAVDRLRRELIWMVTPAGTAAHSSPEGYAIFNFRLYRSTFDNPMNLEQIRITGGPMNTFGGSPITGALSVRFSVVYNGYLHVYVPGPNDGLSANHVGCLCHRIRLY